MELMTAFMIIELEVFGKAGSGLERGVVGPEVDLFGLDASPESLDEDVIDSASLAVSAEAVLMLLEDAEKRLRGELRSLAGVEDRF